MTGEEAGIFAECRKCRNGLPQDARFCRRCGCAQGGDAITRAVRGATRVHRRLLTRSTGPIFGVEPVLWLFAALGGIAISAVVNSDDIFSAYAFGYAVGWAVVLLVSGGVVARIGWLASRRSVTVGILSGMALMFFFTLGVIASTVNPQHGASRGKASSAAIAARVPDVLRNRPAVRTLPPGVIQNLPVRWRVTGRRVECIISNTSPWQIEELQVQVMVFENGRIFKTEMCNVQAVILADDTATVELPIGIELTGRQLLDCRLLMAKGFEGASRARSGR